MSSPMAQLLMLRGLGNGPWNTWRRWRWLPEQQERESRANELTHSFKQQPSWVLWMGD
jgi:hypothetical protein